MVSYSLPVGGALLQTPHPADMLLMEQRRHPRFATNQTIELVLMGSFETRVSARVRDVSSRGLGLFADSSAPQGAALRIEVGEATILGEVIYCHPEPDGYAVGVKLDQVLTGLASLGEALQAFTERPLRGESAYAAINRNKQNPRQS
jgi:hypothetical protein